jgi:hypothetical protein
MIVLIFLFNICHTYIFRGVCTVTSCTLLPVVVVVVVVVVAKQLQLQLQDAGYRSAIHKNYVFLHGSMCI